MAALLKLKAQILVDGEIALGPGKADLLEAIAAHGSISAAARALGLSYRRAWLMVDAMNRLFADPPVQTLRGGSGGASLTQAGKALLADYRALQQAMEIAVQAPGANLMGRLSPRA
jgi:molybdate transport system regulatory protein